MIFKKWINTVFGTTGALEGTDIPYDVSDSVTSKIDAITRTKASQAEVDAGTDDIKFITPLTLESKPKDTGSDLLYTFDLTNAGGNDLGTAQVLHDVSWDQYDELYVELKGVSVSGVASDRAIGVVVYNVNTPTTYIEFVGSGQEAFLMTNVSLDEGDIVDIGFFMSATGVAKAPRGHKHVSATRSYGHATEGLGFGATYAGAGYASSGFDNWPCWPTGGDTWSDHAFDIRLENATVFTGGTLTVRGVNI